MPRVLTENEVKVNALHDWRDVTGEHYHFPNQYKGRLAPGTRFVYYRGVRREDGSRGTPEYFGTGTVGHHWRDTEIPEDAPKRSRRWYCHIDDYVPFSPPVPAKIDDRYLEQTGGAELPPNYWRNGVRRIDESIFTEIVELSGLSPGILEADPLEAGIPLIDEVEIPVDLAEGLVVIPRSPSGTDSGAGAGGGERRPRTAKVTGDRAEEIVLLHLESRREEDRLTDLVWEAKEGRKPGWDIQFSDREGRLVAVEVKGTSGRAFTSVDLTAREWTQAKRLGEQFRLYLVADCLSTPPRIEEIIDPASQVDQRRMAATPATWRLRLIAQRPEGSNPDEGLGRPRQD